MSYIEYKKISIQKDVETKQSDHAILNDFGKKLLESQKDLDPEIVDIANTHFWELLL
jgi:hypothetical protein